MSDFVDRFYLVFSFVLEGLEGFGGFWGVSDVFFRGFGCVLGGFGMVEGRWDTEVIDFGFKIYLDLEF